MSRNGIRVAPTLRSFMGRFPKLQAVLGWKAHVLEVALIVGAYLLYLFTRGVVFSDLYGKGLENAGRVISLEKSLGFFWEPAWQSWILEHAKGLALFLNWTYIVTYWPIILVIGLVLYTCRRRQYYYYRTVVVITLAFALLVFMLFPVTSPFNTGAYFVNTIQELGPSVYGGPEMGHYYNSNAAMPSLHFSWTVILGVAFFRTFRGWFRLLGMVYPVTTFLAIIITGNHFIVDAIAGGLLAAAAFAVMEVGVRLRDRVLPQLWLGLRRRRNRGHLNGAEEWAVEASGQRTLPQESSRPRRQSVVR